MGWTISVVLIAIIGYILKGPIDEETSRNIGMLGKALVVLMGLIFLVAVFSHINR